MPNSHEAVDRAQQALAAAEELRELIRQANGGKLPTGVVDSFLAERRAEADREEAEYDASVRLRQEFLKGLA
jgi:predicted phage gp36 major capsid-like protein